MDNADGYGRPELSISNSMSPPRDAGWGRGAASADPRYEACVGCSAVIRGEDTRSRVRHVARSDRRRGCIASARQELAPPGGARGKPDLGLRAHAGRDVGAVGERSALLARLSRADL